MRKHTLKASKCFCISEPFLTRRLHNFLPVVYIPKTRDGYTLLWRGQESDEVSSLKRYTRGNNMTAKEAKELSIEVWQHIVDNKLSSKLSLPKSLYDKIAFMIGCCPLCEFFRNNEMPPWYCSRCPVRTRKTTCYHYSSSFALWKKTGNVFHAKRILNRIKAWDISKYKG